MYSILPHQFPLQPHQSDLGHLSIIAGSDEAVVSIFEAFLRFAEFEVSGHTLPETLQRNRHVFPGQFDVFLFQPECLLLVVVVPEGIAKAGINLGTAVGVGQLEEINVQVGLLDVSLHLAIVQDGDVRCQAKIISVGTADERLERVDHRLVIEPVVVVGGVERYGWVPVGLEFPKCQLGDADVSLGQ